MFKPLQPCFEVTISSSFQIHEVTLHLSSWNHAFKEWKAKEIEYGSTEQTSKLANAILKPLTCIFTKSFTFHKFQFYGLRI
jgi:hypothetical protein